MNAKLQRCLSCSGAVPRTLTSRRTGAWSISPGSSGESRASLSVSGTLTLISPKSWAKEEAKAGKITPSSSSKADDPMRVPYKSRLGNTLRTPKNAQLNCANRTRRRCPWFDMNAQQNCKKLQGKTACSLLSVPLANMTRQHVRYKEINTRKSRKKVSNATWKI